MRYYRIDMTKALGVDTKGWSAGDIANAELYVGSKTFIGGAQNRAALNIEFEVASFSGGMAALPGFISITNPTPDFFVEAQAYIGGKLVLRAGFEDSMFAKKIGYTFVSEDLIFVGKIANVLGDFSTNEPTLFIFFSIDKDAQAKALEKQKQASKDADHEKKKQLKELTLNIPAEAKVAPFLIKGVQYFTSWLVKPDPLLLTLTNPWTQTIALTASALETLLFLYKEYFDVEIAVNTQQQLITLYESKGATFVTNAVELNSNDFLQQPEILDFGGSISGIVRLRADIQPGTIVNIVGLMPSTAQLAAGVSGGFVSGTVDASKLFVLGSYRITQVTHKGAWANASPESWSTTFTATAVQNKGKGKLTR